MDILACSPAGADAAGTDQSCLSCILVMQPETKLASAGLEGCTCRAHLCCPKCNSLSRALRLSNVSLIRLGCQLKLLCGYTECHLESGSDQLDVWVQWFMEGGAMPKLLQLMHDTDALCRAKALLALSCLIRLSPLALEVFRQKRGVPQLVEAANDSDHRVQK